jgi:hypothetical protein
LAQLLSSSVSASINALDLCVLQCISSGAAGMRWLKVFIALAGSAFAFDASEFDLPLPPACSDGAYRNAIEAVAPWKPGCPGFSLCEPGFWCDGATKSPCPPGTYGSAYGLRTPRCSGLCLEGHYCPQRYAAAVGLTIGSTSPIEKVWSTALSLPFPCVCHGMD